MIIKIWNWRLAITSFNPADPKVVVAAHLRGMWPAPSTDKDILTPNEKLKTLNTTNQTHN